jgi:hypothetical protein
VAIRWDVLEIRNAGEDSEDEHGEEVERTNLPFIYLKVRRFSYFSCLRMPFAKTKTR